MVRPAFEALAPGLRLLVEISVGMLLGGAVERPKGMNELATVHHLVLYAALIVAAMATLEWFESRRARALEERSKLLRETPRS